MAGGAVIARFEQRYRAGDAAGLAALFTATARTSDGSGQTLIRQQYAGLFRDSATQRLSFERVRWHAAGGGRIAGSGGLKVAVKDRASGRWRHLRGGVRIELERTGRGYRIASLFYDLR